MKLAILIAVLLAAAAGAQAEEPYRPGPDDILMILVPNHPELGIEQVIVSRVGTISHPVWGEFGVNGRSLPELEQALKEHLTENYVNDARLTISVVQSNKLLVYLLAPGGVTNAYRLTDSGRLSELLVRAAVTPEDCKRMMALVRRREPRPIRAPADDAEAEEPPPSMQMPLKTTIDLYELMVLGRHQLDLPLRRDDWVQLVHRQPYNEGSCAFVIGDETTVTDVYAVSNKTTVADLLRLASMEDEPRIKLADSRKIVRPGQFLMIGDWPARENEVAVFGEVVSRGVMELKPGMKAGEAVAAAKLTRRAGSLAQVVLARRRGTKLTARSFCLMNMQPTDGFGMNEPLAGGDVLFVIGDVEE